MVKNTNGGNKAKSQGRKFVNTKTSKSLRLADDDCELYAQVVKLLGDGRCDVLCIDGVERMCRIGGKFRGRGKRDNMVGVGSWVLVGTRDWETEKENKKQHCDLLEVYNDYDKEKLRSSVVENWSLFNAYESNLSGVKNNIDGVYEVEFTDDKTDEYKELMEQEINNRKNENKKIILTEDSEVIDVDDI